MTDRELMHQALEALELHAEQYPHMQKGYTVDAITALRERLAQPEQESVKFCTYPKCQTTAGCAGVCARQNTTPQPHQWVGLTDDEIQDLSYLSQKIDASNSPWFDCLGFAKAIEQALKDKNK